MKFDFIIVGAGAAGCIVAEKISRDFSVLLLEAGPEDSNAEGKVDEVIDTHDLWWRCANDARYHWPHLSTPQKHLPSERSLRPNMGRVLGGSTSHNAQFYVRGNPEDFDRWEQVWGMKGWNFGRVLEAWRRLEATNEGVASFHGQDGPLRIRQADDSDVWTSFQEVCKASGVPVSLDHHASQLGAGKLWANVDAEYHRQSLYRAVLHPVREAREADKKLRIEVGATVLRLLWDGSRVVGVEYEHGGKSHKAAASREVILCAGAIKTPHILLLSGIGDRSHLQDHGIEVKVDLPGVGMGLQDHVFTPAFFESNKDFPPTKAWSTFQLFGRNDGTWEGRPDFQVLWCARSTYLPDFPKPGGFENAPVLLAAVCALHPASRGAVTLASADPHAEPQVNPNYMVDPADMLAHRRGFELLSRLSLRLTDWVKSELAPNATSGKALDEWVRASGASMWHPVGTCSMAGPNPVLDTRCRVLGVQGLRVIDASLIPELPSGNTMCPTIAIADIGSSLVLEDHKE